MEKERKIKVLSLVTLIVAVLGLTVAFAALSQTLMINGTASVNAAEWDVHFENLKSEIEGDAKIIKMPTVSENSTYIGDFEVSLTKPGDSVMFTADIVNDGTIDAMEDENSPTINGINMNNIDDTNIVSLLERVFVEADWDGDGVTTDEERMKAAQNISFDFGTNLTNQSIDCDLISGETGTVDFGVIYSEDSEETPKGNVKLRLDIKLNFIQK